MLRSHSLLRTRLRVGLSGGSVIHNTTIYPNSTGYITGSVSSPSKMPFIVQQARGLTGLIIGIPKESSEGMPHIYNTYGCTDIPMTIYVAE